MWRLFLVLLLGAYCGLGLARGGTSGPLSISLADLPPEARQTLIQIEQGGPFLFRRDGIVFGNYEKRLPLRTRGYYREYTVPTPGAHGRGARRIIGGEGGERYYTPDHYQHFWRIHP